MTVQFVESPTELNALLWPKLSQTHGTASRVLLAVLVKGIANGVSTDDIRQWMRHSIEAAPPGQIVSLSARHGFDEQSGASSDSAAVTRGAPSMLELLSWSKPWIRLCAAAERKVDSSPSSPGGEDIDQEKLVAARTRMSEIVLVGLLLPWSRPCSITQQVAKRVTLAEFAMVLLEDEQTSAFFGEARTKHSGAGMDSAYFTQPRLAAMTGWSARKAFTYLDVLVEDGALTRLSPPGDHGKFRMRQPSSKRIKQVREYRSTIESIADDTPEPIADVIRSISHPAWGYSSVLSHKHWLVLLADAAEVPMSNFGMRPEAENLARGALARADLGTTIVTLDLVDRLNKIAMDPDLGTIEDTTRVRLSAFDAAESAYKKWAEGASVERQKRQEFKKNYQEARAAENERQRNAIATRKVESTERSEHDHSRSPSSMLELLNELTPPVAPDPAIQARTFAQQNSALIQWLKAMREAVVKSSERDEPSQSSRLTLTRALKAANYGTNAATRLAAHVLDGAELPREISY